MTWQRLLRGGVHDRGSGISLLGLRCGGGAVSSVLSSVYFSQFGPIQLQLRRCRADMFKDFSVDGTSINDGFTDGGFWDEAISEPLAHDDLRFHCLLKDSPRLRGPPPILTESQASCHLSQQRILARSVLVKPRRHRPTDDPPRPSLGLPGRLGAASSTSTSSVVVLILRRMVEQANDSRMPIFVMDCDMAAAFDHVSHHLIIDAMEALNVPPVLVAAWIRVYRSSETRIKLDDIFTPGIRRTRSVPQGDPCAANVFGASLDVPATAFCKRCHAEKWRLPVDGKYMGLLLFADSCWLVAML